MYKTLKSLQIVKKLFFVTKFTSLNIFLFPSFPQVCPRPPITNVEGRLFVIGDLAEIQLFLPLHLRERACPGPRIESGAGFDPGAGVRGQFFVGAGPRACPEPVEGRNLSFNK